MIMIIYAEISYLLKDKNFNYNTYHQSFLVDVKSIDIVKTVIKSVMKTEYSVDENSISFITILPADLLTNNELIDASRNIIYEDLFFNKWKLKTSQYPNFQVLANMKYKKINIYCTPDTDSSSINADINFLMMNFLVSKEKINVLPFISKDDHGDIKLDDIIKASIPEILYIIILPKNTDVPFLINIMKRYSEIDNCRFYINDSSNQLFEIENDNDVIILKRT